ncbi:MAG TPA: hypothetical protein VGM92_14915 [Candidatus Kapabacteria bacterium]
MPETTHTCTNAAVLDPPMLATEAAMMPHLGMEGPISILGSAPWPDEPWWRRLAPSTLYVLLSAAVAIFFLAHELAIAGHLGFPLIESWVRVAYAKNFFHHLAFEYASGESSPAPTSPFWIVVLSLAVNLFRDPIVAGKLLGTIFLFLTGYYSFRLLRALELDYGTSLIAGIFMVTSSALAWAELSGLESTLSTALIVGALWWHFSHPGKVPEWLHFFVAGAILALGTLTRPEIALIFAIIATWQFVEDDQYKFWHAFMLVVGFVLVLGPVAITNYTVSGAFVPSTFRSAIGHDSIIRAIWHGNGAAITMSVLHAFVGILATLRDVYLSSNPVWTLAIVLAVASRFRRRITEGDAADPLFSLSVFVLIAYPYLHTLLIGDADGFGASARLAHFLIPIYTLAGILSIRILARRELFRSIHPKAMLLWAALILGVLGTLDIALFSSADSPMGTGVTMGLLLFFLLVLLYAGLRRTGLSILKVEQRHEVTEAERLETHFSFHDDAEFDPRLSKPAVSILRATLLVLLAWNLATLPRAANDFALHVKRTNQAITKDQGTLTFPNLELNSKQGCWSFLSSSGSSYLH